ncbi:hypothetical protein BDR22DRAFT_816033, partial [Usnea florida]
RPNIYITLYYEDVVKEYITLNNYITLSREDKYRYILLFTSSITSYYTNLS